MLRAELMSITPLQDFAAFQNIDLGICMTVDVAGDRDEMSDQK